MSTFNIGELITSETAHVIAQERDTALRECEEALQEAGRLRARVEELTAQPEIAEAVRRIEAIHVGDPEGAHSEVDAILLACVPAEVREAHARLLERADWWATA